MHVKGESDVIKYLVTLGKIILEINKGVVVNRSPSLDSPAHPFQPGNWVYVKSWNSEPLTEKWKGPFQVLLIMYTTVKVEGKGPWIHYSWFKKAPQSWEIKQQSSLKFKLDKVSKRIMFLVSLATVELTGNGWDQNTHLFLIQSITQILHKNDCWICTQCLGILVKGKSLIGIPLPLNVSWTNRKDPVSKWEM